VTEVYKPSVFLVPKRPKIAALRLKPLTDIMCGEEVLFNAATPTGCFLTVYRWRQGRLVVKQLPIFNSYEHTSGADHG
jgi:hypothetical protein